MRRARARRAACAAVAAPAVAALVLAQAPSAGAASLVPAKASTVLTLEPLNYGLFESTPRALQGSLCKPPNNCIGVKRPNSIDPTQGIGLFHEFGAIAMGAEKLNTQLEASSADGPELVVGVSQGAQVAAHWLGSYGPSSDLDRDAVSFLLMANPANRYGVPWAPKVPNNSGFDVTGLWLQYDGWSDWPDRFNLLAIANAVYGMFFVHPSGLIDVDPEDPSIVEWSTDGVNYKMVPTDTLPILDPLRFLGLGWVADLINDPLLDHVETAYDRPSTQEEADELFPAATEADEPTTHAVAATEKEPIAADPGSDIEVDTRDSETDQAEAGIAESDPEMAPKNSDLVGEADELADEIASEADAVEEAEELAAAVEEDRRASETEPSGAVEEAPHGSATEQGAPGGTETETSDVSDADSTDSPSEA